MKKYCKYLYAIPMVAALLAHSSCHSNDQIMINTSTVKQFDIPRFMGKWYEIARYEHTFEKGMSHVTAEYSLLSNGKIRVINRGIKNGKPKEIIGKAKQPYPIEYPGRLKVSFFLWFYADYYILELDKEYQYAIIGSSSDKYLWILSRTPDMPEEKLNEFLQNIKRRGTHGNPAPQGTEPWSGKDIPQGRQDEPFPCGYP